MSDLLDSRLDGGLGILYIDQALDLVDPVRGDKAVSLLSRRVDKDWCSEIGLKPKDHVFVISHREEFKDRFESTIFAEKENGVCRIV
jgi:DNA repair exonuclease SbcCD ATPase subunit